MVALHYTGQYNFKRESNLLVLTMDHLTTLSWGREKKLETSYAFWTKCLQGFQLQLSQHCFSFLSFPNSGQLFLLCAWHVITTLICVVSFSLSPYFCLSLWSFVTFSNSLWKPKELVRAWLTLLLFLLLLHPLDICVTVLWSLCFVGLSFYLNLCVSLDSSSIVICQWCFNSAHTL